MENKELKNSLKYHIGGKIKICSRVSLKDRNDLSLAYTPGVADPCIEINKDLKKVYDYTSKGHTVLVVSDGTAVLGLGDIGPLAAIPVMEGKALLFKKFANIDAIPICLNTKNVEEIIQTIKFLSPSFGAVNMEDISAPRCVEIERRLIKELNIPVFHDDQHGSAIVVGAALLNALKVVGKDISKIKVVVSGTGAAGSSTIKIIKSLGVNSIYAYNINGVVNRKYYNSYDFLVKELLDQNYITSSNKNSLSELLIDADVFIGVSGPNLVTAEMVKTMAKDAIVFALANPIPEIYPEEAIKGGAKIIGTGRSDYPNQINNVLAFPGIFKGVLEAKAEKITEEMKITAAYAIANLIKNDELKADYIIPNVFDKRVVKVVSNAVKKIALKDK